MTRSAAQIAQLERARQNAHSPSAIAARSEKMKRRMADPANYAKQMEAMHSPEARRKAAEATKRPAADRFASYASPEPNTGCWLWSGSCDRRGYGQLRVDGRLRFASRIALELDGRPRPFEGACARHKCDFPPCVNPDHLEWGTRKENTADAISRGRLNTTGLELGRKWWPR
jgi:hypothetical protein